MLGNNVHSKSRSKAIVYDLVGNKFLLRNDFISYWWINLINLHSNFYLYFQQLKVRKRLNFFLQSIFKYHIELSFFVQQICYIEVIIKAGFDCILIAWRNLPRFHLRPCVVTELQGSPIGINPHHLPHVLGSTCILCWPYLHIKAQLKYLIKAYLSTHL